MHNIQNNSHEILKHVTNNLSSTFGFTEVGLRNAAEMLEVVGLAESGTDEIPGILNSSIHSHWRSDLHMGQRARICFGIPVSGPSSSRCRLFRPF